MWKAVRERFRRFHVDLNVTQSQIDDGVTKAINVGKALERAYTGTASDTPPVFFVGSWGKGTQLRPSADIDIMANFDWSVYQRFEQRANNKQSQLLQEIRESLAGPYPQTEIRADGQVVVIGFNTITVELVPVFRYPNGQFLMPDSNNGGRWKIVDPFAQIALVERVDAKANGNLRALTKMVKLWNREKRTSLKSFVLELLVAEFMDGYVWATRDYFWYDYFVRDFFQFLRAKSGTYLTIPGTGEAYYVGTDWATRVDTAIENALRACYWEYHDYDVTAGQEWQKIFGPRIPIYTA
ncbi:nucleotidyltransferase [Neorhizobium sp. P12A]|uniref:SMODS domain-containing nucleotidyltransferase n=1 Tax=Neorhizobium sp. P12A TaxID=2268027 RepID=UPI0011ECE857|nr:nucleotidyltransferase [Neorhizobium sp. P12A]